ncbi:DUF3991 domain-containing protein [Listeria monocytogenes]|uniref:DUF3991 domain-containing protein n=1 Tax=Listeria monocytogenes TaxID=1639 RepID=UPI0010B6CA4F|nr:DUF3991 domain-containing protein [Listeria monocytogenes]EAF4456037.1 DUF3991 domain-containing protein [Listeria monocytogenes serotype 4b]EHC6194440.1 DUF3991 domain-containing protein [Listeria monocytogenes serotype 1/2a]EAC3131978.1 DUF3991 domain-containing protein [Listeria monocytogenes]EAC6780745.1 DUF3991 domain-containing protein [Listeria monocytogenes]EAD0722614.1 DUF3991 domain-containing protein [Listeria monocytogenes]
MIQQKEGNNTRHRRFTETEIKKVAGVDMVSYLEKKGEPLNQAGKYYYHKEHDSLVLCPEKGYFTWNSRGVSDRSCIKLAMELFDLSFIEAVQDVLEQNIPEHEKEVRQVRQASKKKPFSYWRDIKEANNQDKLKQYLIGERKINPWLVSELIQKKYIVQDKQDNVVYKWFHPLKKNEVIGAAKEGVSIIPEAERWKPSMKRFKQVMVSGDNGFYFDVGKTNQINQLYVFESPVDMMSYLSLKMQRGDQSIRNARFLAMDGVKPMTFFHHYTLLSAKLDQPIQPIVCVDNDAAGHQLLDALHPFEYLDEAGNDTLRNDIPYDLAISREMAQLYKVAAERYQVDWKWIAAIHKSETNSKPEGKVANSSYVQQFFSTPKKDEIARGEYSIENEIIACAKKISQQPPGKINMASLYQDTLKSDSVAYGKKAAFFEKLSYYHQKYTNGNHYFVEQVPKDWNEILVAIQTGQTNVYTLLSEEEVMSRAAESLKEKEVMDEVGIQHA